MESASPAALPASEEAIPVHMQPLCIQLGGVKWVYRCQVEGCREGPSTSHATICAHVCKVHLGVGLVCPSYDPVDKGVALILGTVNNDGMG